MQGSGTGPALLKKDNTFTTYHSVAAVPDKKALQPLEVYSPRENPALKLALLPALEILEHCFQQNYTHIHAAA